MMIDVDNPYRPSVKSRSERRAGKAARLGRAAACFEADLDPETGAPRIRFNFFNGWTASLVLRMRSNATTAMMASVAAWPTGHCGKGLTELGPTEASADEALNWIDDIRSRDAR